MINRRKHRSKRNRASWKPLVYRGVEQLEPRIVLHSPTGLDDSVGPDSSVELPMGHVHGSKWEDLDGDAVRGPEERGLPGIEIFSDLNRNGQLDNGEPHTHTVPDNPDTDFDESGKYVLSGLRPGVHFIFEVLPDGYSQTFPRSPVPVDLVRDDGMPFFPRQVPHVVFVAPGKSVDDIDFGNRPANPGSVQGMKWHDANGDGHWDRNETGLGGVTIFSDRNHNGVVDDGEPSTTSAYDDPQTTSNEAGSYALNNLLPGPHSIREIVPDGYQQTYPMLPAILADDIGISVVPGPIPQPGIHHVIVHGGETIEGLDFGNQKIQAGSLHGVKWGDVNGDGGRDSDEKGLPDVVVYSDGNHNGVLDPGEPWTTTLPDDNSTTEDEAGYYVLAGLRPGFHAVREVVPEGMVQTFPKGATTPRVEPLQDDLIPLPPVYDGAHVVHLESGGKIEGLDFGNRTIRNGSIQGRKWSDTNGNGERETNETGLSDVTIYLDLNKNSILDDNEPRTVTIADDPETDFDESGRYRLSHLASGVYLVREVVPDGFMQTYPLSLTGFAGAHEIRLEPGEHAEGADFGNRPIRDAAIQGMKWMDWNGNARRDAAEPGIPGVTIYVDTNHNGHFDDGEPFGVTSQDNPRTARDEQGRYELANLAAGEYWVREIVPEGFRQTYPRRLLSTDPEPVGVDPKTLAMEVNPSAVNVFLAANEVHAMDISLTIHPLLFVPVEVDVVASDEDASFVNLDGVQANGGGGSVSSFDVLLIGQSKMQEFDVHFIDATFGSQLATIPVRVRPLSQGGQHRVVLESGEVADGVDFGNQPVKTGSIRGVKWKDQNGNGLRDSQEPGLPGVTVYLDLDSNGKWNTGEPHAVTMKDHPFTRVDEAGAYWITGLAAGDYVVREVVPDGFVQTYPMAVTGVPGSHAVFVKPGQQVAGIDFGNRRLEFGAVQGSKWSDVDGDGERDAHEAGLAGVKIFSDFNNNQVLDAGEPYAVTSEDIPETDFDETGLFALDHLRPGLHFIYEVVPHDYVQTYPMFDVMPAIFPPPAVPHEVMVKPGVTVAGIDFGNRPIGTGMVHGAKWKDLNGNGQREKDEPGIAGVMIYSDVNRNQRFDAGEPHTVSMKDDPLTRPDETGEYWLKSLRPGSHTIREVVPAGMQQTFPLGPTATTNLNETRDGADDFRWEPANPILPPYPGGHHVYVRSGEIIDQIDFGNRPLTTTQTVNGVKWLDVNGNGVRDNNEPGLSGVVVYADLNNNGGLDNHEPHAVTMEDIPLTKFDETGLYKLEELKLGPHVLREVIPTGFVQTFPGEKAGGAHEIIVGSGGMEAFDFGNQLIRMGRVHGQKWADRNGNGQRESHERGIPGVVIYSDLNGNGRLDHHEPMTVTVRDDRMTAVNETGRFELKGLAPGQHSIREVVPPGFVQTYPKSVGNKSGGAHEVSIESGMEIGQIDFGNRSRRFLPPQLTGVFVRGNEWIESHLHHLEASGLGDAELGYAVHGGTEGINLPGYSNLDEITVTFNRPIDLDEDDLGIVGIHGDYEVKSFSYDEGTWVATWKLTKPLSWQDAAIHAQFADSDDAENEDFSFAFRAVPGNTDSDCDIDISDFNTLTRNFDPIGQRNMRFPSQGNFNGDDVVDVRDFNSLASNFNPSGNCNVPQDVALLSGVSLTANQAVGVQVFVGNSEKVAIVPDENNEELLQEGDLLSRPSTGSDGTIQHAVIDDYFAMAGHRSHQPDSEKTDLLKSEVKNSDQHDVDEVWAGVSE